MVSLDQKRLNLVLQKKGKLKSEALTVTRSVFRKRNRTLLLFLFLQEERMPNLSDEYSKQVSLHMEPHFHLRLLPASSGS